MSANSIETHSNRRLAKALSTWSDWGLPLTARPEILEQVPGGRTNRNFRLAAPGLDNDLLLRLNHPEPRRLGIQRAAEREIMATAAESGISRPFWYWDPADQFVVFPWLTARAWTAEDFACPEQRGRLLNIIAQVRLLEAPRPRRAYLPYVEHYWWQLKNAGLIDRTLDQRWQSIRPRLVAFDLEEWPSGLVHHDLIPANILETADQLYVIDWEYAARGHPDIDLWSLDPSSVREPFVPELMSWINHLWERLAQAQSQ
ncbi:MAG TPA: phosphotransferase [Wenzhouxiangella sp.]|nr:phosphotransferase [Wenzhouxiangella sp.]